MSDGEDDGEGNELEYDDFFLRDNDFGSDADSDGEVMAAVAMRLREGEERVGPRFIRGVDLSLTPPSSSAGASHTVSLQQPARKGVMTMNKLAFKLDGSGSLLACEDQEKDVVRLSAYSAVIQCPALLPVLGEASVESKKAVGESKKFPKGDDGTIAASIGLGEGEVEAEAKKGTNVARTFDDESVRSSSPPPASLTFITPHSGGRCYFFLSHAYFAPCCYILHIAALH